MKGDEFMRVSIDKEAFLIDGKRTKIISGAIHYFRVVPEYWYDRLAKLKAFGIFMKPRKDILILQEF